MNGKTAKMLRRHCVITKVNLKRMKRIWKKVPVTHKPELKSLMGKGERMALQAADNMRHQARPA